MNKNYDFDMMLLDVISCKWTRKILQAILNETNRPGMLERELTGISTKVMNESLRRMVDYGFLTRQDFNEKPRRVEYQLTDLGEDALSVIELAQELKQKYNDK